MARDIDRRTVLQTTGGLLAGVPMLAGQVAGDEIKLLNMDVRQETINPEEAGVIPVEVTVPEGLLPDDVSFPTDTFMGVGKAFETLEEGELVHITDEYEDGVVNPVRARSVAGHEGHWIMHFDNRDIRYPEPDHWDGTLGLGVFPDGVDDFVPGDHWDADSVRIPPRGRDN